MSTAAGTVQIAYLHGGRVSHSFHDSMTRMIAYDSGTDQRIVRTQGPFAILTGSVDVPDNRNFATRKFLDETDYEWLFFVDTDMGFLPDSVDRLVAAADPEQRPVVGGLCFSARAVAYDGYGGARIGVRPTIFMPARNDEGVLGFKAWPRYPENTVMRVGATGAAFLLLHRGALEKVRAEFGDEWWSMTRYADGQLLSEDLSFCARAGVLEIPIHVHTGVKTTHHKQIWISEFEYEQPEEPIAPGGDGDE